jgi:DNA-binding beta-propeller fold protein YncE
MRRAISILAGLAAISSIAYIANVSWQASKLPLPTGKFIDPIDRGVDVGSFPVKMALSDDGKWLVVTNSGFREFLSVIDTATGKVVSQLDFNGGMLSKKDSLYFGIQFAGGKLYVSRGFQEKISEYSLGADGKLSLERDIPTPSAEGDRRQNFVAGVAASGATLHVAFNESYPEDRYAGRVAEVSLTTGRTMSTRTIGSFPLDVLYFKDRVVVSCEGEGGVYILGAGDATPAFVKTGLNPTHLVNVEGKIYVANSGSDTICEVDPIKKKVVRTMLVRPAALRGIPGGTPLGMAATKDGKLLLIAMADLNAVAVLDLKNGHVRGFVPTGWYPTDVKVTADNKSIFVANARGVLARVPNKDAKGPDRRGANLLEGTISMIPMSAATTELEASTKRALAANRLDKPAKTLKNPGIKHVIYIIKENRTYDNVYGDMPTGNSDASLCLFPREVTPNQHALAERFVQLDNFYVCAEVSGDGWNWSTAGMANEYVSRNVMHTYSGRGRDYDFEGLINGGRPEFMDKQDPAKPPGGYIWDLCAKNHVSYRNYGFFTGDTDEFGVGEREEGEPDNVPMKKALVPHTDVNFRQFDLSYPDSDLTAKYGLVIPNELKSFGKKHSASRFSEWKKEFDEFIKSGNMPKFMMVRLPRNHTVGTARGRLSPRAMAADNDYAVGQVVEAVSHCRYWKDTAICVLEDDAQSGIDHVDSHRSGALVISPFVKRGSLDSRFYNTDGMLRTIELLLGMGPMNTYDAVADPLDVFEKEASNIDPFDAIMPAKEIAAEMNGANAYRAADSEKMMNLYEEESLPDIELNDILYGSILGRPLGKSK